MSCRRPTTSLVVVVVAMSCRRPTTSLVVVVVAMSCHRPTTSLGGGGSEGDGGGISSK